MNTDSRGAGGAVFCVAAVDDYARAAIEVSCGL